MLTLSCPVPDILSKLNAGTISVRAKNKKAKVRVSCGSFEIQWVEDAEADAQWAIMARHAVYIWAMKKPELKVEDGFLHAQSGQHSIKAPLLQEETIVAPMRLGSLQASAALDGTQLATALEVLDGIQRYFPNNAFGIAINGGLEIYTTSARLAIWKHIDAECRDNQSSVTLDYSLINTIRRFSIARDIRLYLGNPGAMLAGDGVHMICVGLEKAIPNPRAIIAEQQATGRGKLIELCSGDEVLAALDELNETGLRPDNLEYRLDLTDGGLAISAADANGIVATGRTESAYNGQHRTFYLRGLNLAQWHNTTLSIWHLGGQDRALVAHNKQYIWMSGLYTQPKDTLTSIDPFD